MKTIQLLTLALFISLTTFTNAQDASNNATWEETIDFLNKNKQHFSVDWIKDELRTTFSNFHIENYKYLTIKRDGAHRVSTDTIDLDYLFTVQVESEQGHFYENWIWLELSSEDYGKRVFKKKIENKDNFKTDITSFYIKDKIMFARIAKAFQHLAYLAIKKREEERNASGDKF